MMSDGSLSQDEIDALLQGGGGFDFDEPDSSSGGSGDALSDAEKNAFANTLAGLSDTLASNLSGLVGSSVSFSRPRVEIIANGTFVASLPPQIVQVGVDFTGEAEGVHSLIFSPELATIVAGLMMGQEGVELNDAALSALEEAGNTLTGAEATAFSDKSGGNVGTAPGTSRTGESGEVGVPDGSFLKATWDVTIEGQEPAQIIEVFSLPVIRGVEGAAPAAPARPAPGRSGTGGGGARSGAGRSGGASTDPFGGMDFGGDDLLSGSGGGLSGPSVQSVQFPNLGGGMNSQEQGNISLLMDVYMEMTVELGRTKKLIRDILGMGEGTIIELDKLAGEPVDILVNHKLIAKGEVVVIDENFGVRVTEIVDPMDRMPEM
jgi:flagellar motor switch protein FliN